MSRAGTIDGLKFALERSRVSGRLSLAALPRLADSGCTSAEIAFAIAGGTGAEGQPYLRVTADGAASMTCQRCLLALPVPIAVDAELELAESREAAEAAEDEVDRVVASRSMDVAALVEDELLLALPMVAVHEGCELPAKDEGPRPSPFAALAGLRRGGSG
jgi:uncharacterized protein